MIDHPGGWGRLAESPPPYPPGRFPDSSGWGTGDPFLERVGNTPLIEIERCFRPGKVRILAKCEWFNPGGSVKDRAALNMILEAERSGRLTPERIILDATSGNTGIAYAWVAARRGYRVELAIPGNASPERIQILRGYGVELILTDPLEGSDGAIEVARRRYQQDPERYFYPDQYANPANWQAHYRTTGPEILRQTGGRITHFVAGLGTTGTFTGVARRLTEFDSGIECVGVIPASPMHGLEGLKHLPTAAHVPAIYEPQLVDRRLEIETEEGQRTAVCLARDEGLLVGPSAGAALAAAIQVARDLDEGVVVTLFPDGGQKYLSEQFWKSSPDGGR